MRELRVVQPELRPDFAARLRSTDCGPLLRRVISTAQVNVGKRCNQACHHCHVDAGPRRTEEMSAEVAERVLELIGRSPGIAVVDITGGAPELNPHFRRLVQRSRELGKAVIDRCNLTILSEPGQEDLAEFLAAHRVHVIASLPCYSAKNVESQRGKGVFARSIDGLRRLNELGYGMAESGLDLDLVYNPGGAFLPPPQQDLERDYKERLRGDFGIEFGKLLTLTNMPISRFAHALERDGQLDAYYQLLDESFNPTTIASLMCRDQVSIGYDGSLYDCDFNQMLELGIDAPTTVWDLDSFAALEGGAVRVASHCFGCTAGSGSSCGGALA